MSSADYERQDFLGGELLAVFCPAAYGAWEIWEEQVPKILPYFWSLGIK